MARIGSARCALQIDVGFGDAVTPGPQIVAYPILLKDFQALTLRVYPVYTVVAEKYQAMVMLGQANNRFWLCAEKSITFDTIRIHHHNQNLD